MNRVEWVQQREDYKTTYHVLKWRTSHFHEPFSRRMVASASRKPEAAAAVPAAQKDKDAEGMSAFQAASEKSGRLRLGLGLEDIALRSLSEGERNGASVSGREGVQGASAAQRGLTVGQTAQITLAERMVTPGRLSASPVEPSPLETAKQDRTTVLSSNQGDIRGRLRESAKRLLEFYQKWREKAAKIPFLQGKTEKPAKKKKTETLRADREAMLSMQAENHYLLDSYDQRGNYSMLGK